MADEKLGTINLVPVSGGKDSQATLIMAIKGGAENIIAVFADTGIEHVKTYEHLKYIQKSTGIRIQTIKADFAQKIAQKRIYIDFIWRSEGVSSAVCDRAISVLEPTGIPFLDLCLWKGRFPGHASAQFCSIELKQKPMEDYQMYLFNNCCKNLFIWQGTRRDESLRRSNLTPWEAQIGNVYDRTGLLIHRPIVYWNRRDVFNFLFKSGSKPNPLYEDGFTRVGCMPCKNEIKNSVRIISERYPEYIDRVAEFESLVSSASKQGVSTFFDARNSAKYSGIDRIETEAHGVRTYVKWATSSKRGRHWQNELFSTQPECASSGYCE